MKVFQLRIECEGAAFDERWREEVARILDAAAMVVDYSSYTEGYLRDHNGNRCGSWKFTEEAGK